MLYFHLGLVRFLYKTFFIMGKYIKDHFSLLEHQVDAVKGLVSRRRAVLVDSVGNGKTMECLYGYSYLRHKGLVDFAIVLTPKNAYDKRVWEEDARKHTHLKCISFDDVIRKMDFGDSVESLSKQYDFIYAKHTHCKTAYDYLRRWYVYKGLRLLSVVDELHVVRNPKAALTQAMRLLMGGTYALWGITATILSKSCMDTYNIINFVYPRYFPSYRMFQQEFCRVEDKVVGRKPDGSLRRVSTVTDYKDVGALQKYCDGVLVAGVSSVPISYHLWEYEMSPEEASLYSLIARGLCGGSDDMDDESWLRSVLRGDIGDVGIKTVKDLQRHSSRFMYLQSVVNGALGLDGVFGLYGSQKVDRLLDLCREIASRNESALIYCETYTSIDVLFYFLSKSGIVDGRGRTVSVAEQSGRRSQEVTRGMCMSRSTFVLISKAKTESANWTFVNNAILFDIPTVPSTIIQFVGRIQRRSSEHLGNLHAWYLHSNDISEYKMRLSGSKIYFQEGIAFDVNSFPREYIKAMESASNLRAAKQYLLWADRSIVEKGRGRKLGSLVQKSLF